MIRESLLSLLTASALVASIASAAADTFPKEGDGIAVDAGAARSEVLDEVVVTAERREASVQKTPLNISVVTGETLAKQGIGDSRALLDSITGLKINSSNPNAYIGLYGLASGSGTQYADPVMALNYGGVPLARQTAGASSFYDIERIEVLKGPQGTLYGRNATVGAINVLPTRPKDSFEGGATITAGNYRTINATGYLNLPLSDTVSSRLAFQSSRHDGYYTNGLDDADNYGVRGSIKWDPNADLSVLLWGDAFVNRSKGPYSTFQFYLSNNQRWINDDPWFGIGAPWSCASQLLCPTYAAPSAGGVNAFTPPGGTTSTRSPLSIGNRALVGRDGYSNIDQIIGASEINYSLRFGTVTIIPAYVHTKIDFISYSNGLLFGNRTEANQESIEARLASDDNGRLKWVLGSFYYHEKQDAWQMNGQTTGVSLFTTPHLTDENYAFFGDATLSLSDSLRVSAGLRYTHETKTQDGNTLTSGITAAQVPIIVRAGGTCVAGATPDAPVVVQGWPEASTYCSFANGGRFSDSAISWKLGAELDLGPEAMLYATARTGYRAGGLAPGTDNIYGPETPLTYELGLRSRFFDRRLQVNLTGFYWDYKDQQLSQLKQYFVNGIAVGQTSFPSNYDGSFHGFESDIQLLITRNDRIGLNMLYTEGTYDSTPPVSASTGTIAQLFDLPRINMPQWTAVAAYSHGFTFSNGATLVPEGRMHYESSARLRIIDPALLVPGDIRNAYTKFSASLTYNAPDENWSLSAFIDNITNEAVVGVGSSGQTSPPVFFRPSSNPNDVRSASLDPPRTYGLRLTARF